MTTVVAAVVNPCLRKELLSSSSITTTICNSRIATATHWASMIPKLSIISTPILKLRSHFNSHNYRLIKLLYTPYKRRLSSTLTHSNNAGLNQKLDSTSDSGSPSIAPPNQMSSAENKIFQLLSQELKPNHLEVTDISGGCGSMYNIQIVSERFTGLNLVQQQKVVLGVLGEMVKEWHGLTLNTKSP